MPGAGRDRAGDPNRDPADAARVQQMLLNPLGNASKYTQAEGEIHLTATVESSEGVVRVTDSGMGIAQAILPHIFELFTRGDAVGRIPRHGRRAHGVRELAMLYNRGVKARSRGQGRAASSRYGCRSMDHAGLAMSRPGPAAASVAAILRQPQPQFLSKATCLSIRCWWPLRAR